MNDEEVMSALGTQQLQGQLGMNAMQTQQQLMFNEQEQGLAAEQLDVEKILEGIYALLQGKEYKDNGHGVREWIEPTNQSMKILSDWGVQRIMQTVRFHINKNTLLSWYDEREIKSMMLHFTTELNDLFYMKYRQILREPTFEECKVILLNRLSEREKLRVFALEILGQKPNKEQIKKEMLREIEGTIAKEIQKIKNDQLNDRIKEYGLLLWEVEQAVLSTFNRAYFGKERETLRKHAQFSEIRSLNPPVNNKGGIGGWLKG